MADDIRARAERLLTGKPYIGDVEDAYACAKACLEHLDHIAKLESDDLRPEYDLKTLVRVPPEKVNRNAKIAELRELIREVRLSGVSHETTKYLEVQISRILWDDLKVVMSTGKEPQEEKLITEEQQKQDLSEGS